MSKEKLLSVVDSVTGKTFIFKNHEDKKRFFDTWDELVVKVEDSQEETRALDQSYYEESVSSGELLNALYDEGFEQDFISLFEKKFNVKVNWNEQCEGYLISG